MSTESDARPPSTRRLGRRVALALYFVFLGYLAIIGFASVTPQVFFAEPSGTIVSDCGATRGELVAELRTVAGDYVKSGGTSDRRLDSFFSSWDDRYRSLADQCDDEPTASLGRLRYRLETTLRRYGREEAPLLRSLAREAGTAHETP